jgi:hypothetical protein
MNPDLRSLLTQPAKSAATAGQRHLRRRMLEDCWPQIWRVLGLKLPDVLIEALGPLAKDEDPEVAKPGKMVLVRDRAFCEYYEQSLKSDFLRGIEDFIAAGQTAASKAPAAAKPGASALSALSLVEFGDMELNTLLDASASRVRNRADDAYTSIRLRLANALREPEVRDTENPFRPSMFFRALHTALTKLAVLDERTVMQLLPRFDAPMVKPLMETYAALDRHLSAQGHANEVARNTVFRNTSAGRTTRLGPQTSGIAAGLGGVHAEQMLHALYSRLQLVSVGPSAAAAAGGPATGAAATGAGGAVAGGPLLDSLLRGGAAGAGAASGGAGPSIGGVGGIGGAGGGGAGGHGYGGAGMAGAGGLHSSVVGGGGAGGVGHAGGVSVAAVGAGGLAGWSGLAGVPLLPQEPGAPLPKAGPALLQPATVALPGAPVVISVDLLNAINEIQKLGAMALNAVRQGEPAPDAVVESAELRNKLVEKATEQVDKLTIEIVGLLFDRIEADKHVPQPIKELLARLQFPLIKVALTDPALFVTADQPARRLMDRIASTSVGWTSEGEGNERYLAEVQQAIHTVLAATEEGITAFERALQQFEAYLQDERTRDDDPVLRAKRALAAAEDREIMVINATIKIRSAFDGVQVESYLREFLLDTWVRVLVAVTVRDRDDNSTVRRYLGIVPDLVWSVQPKLSQDDRHRLVGTIPAVLRTLREGLMLIEWPQERMQAFFGQLMNSHAQAVKALELAHGNPGVPFEASTMRIKLDGIRLDEIGAPPEDTRIHVSDEQVRQVLAAEHADVQHLAPPTTQATVVSDRPDLSDDALDARIAAFRRGDWFNLRLGDVVERVQLRWVSPRKTLYLFTPAERRSGHSLSPESLRAYLRSGDLAPVESEPLFDRAVHDVVQELQRSAADAPQA